MESPIIEADFYVPELDIKSEPVFSMESSTIESDVNSELDIKYEPDETVEFLDGTLEFQGDKTSTSDMYQLTENQKPYPVGIATLFVTSIAGNQQQIVFHQTRDNMENAIISTGNDYAHIQNSKLIEGRQTIKLEDDCTPFQKCQDYPVSCDVSIENEDCRLESDINEKLYEHPDQETDKRTDVITVLGKRRKKHPFECKFPLCGFIFSTSELLQDHVETHKDLPCNGLEPGCNKDSEINYKGNLYHCRKPGCGMVFHNSKELKSHWPVHSNEKLFECSIPGCIQSFKSSRLLKMHMNVHLKNSRPFKCRKPGCDEAFNFEKDYKNHIQTHSKYEDDRAAEGPFNYSCVVPGCGMRFNESYGLYKHRKCHLYTYVSIMLKCPKCDQRFRNPSNYEKHMKRAHRIFEYGPPKEPIEKDYLGNSFNPEFNHIGVGRTYTRDKSKSKLDMNEQIPQINSEEVGRTYTSVARVKSKQKLDVNEQMIPQINSEEVGRTYTAAKQKLDVNEQLIPQINSEEVGRTYTRDKSTRRRKYRYGNNIINQLDGVKIETQ